MTHLGKNIHRWRDNPLELEFATQWQSQAPGILPYIFGDGSREVPLTKEQEAEAATVIQWLGSPVGQSFLRTVLATGAGRRFLDTVPLNYVTPSCK